MSLAELHQPSSAAPASSSTAQAASSAPPSVQSELKRLTDKRADVQAQLDVYFSVLSSVRPPRLLFPPTSSPLTTILIHEQNNVKMDTPLIDREGFPRSDIDVASVRTARVQIIRLRNDLKAVMGELEEVVKRGLPKGEEREEEERIEDVEMVEKEQGEGGEEKPWAKVDAVAPGSPADTAVRLLLRPLASLSSADN
jgi:26S proteasome non-ATPase regulatory subunit 9